MIDSESVTIGLQEKLSKVCSKSYLKKLTEGKSNDIRRAV